MLSRLILGADLQNLVNQAALEAARKGKESVEMRDLEFSKDKILMGKSVDIIQKLWRCED